MTLRTRRILSGAMKGFCLVSGLAFLVVAILGGFSGNDETLGSLAFVLLLGVIGALVGALVQDHRFPPD